MNYPEGFELLTYGAEAEIVIYGSGGHAVRVADELAIRVLAELPLEQFGSDVSSAGATVIQLDHDRGPETDRLLDSVAAAAELDGDRFVVTMPLPLLDYVWRVKDPNVAMLIEPSAVEIGAAIAIAAAAPKRSRLHDIGRDGGSLQLIELTEELGRVARKLAALSEAVPGRASQPPLPSLTFAPPPDPETEARSEDPTAASSIRAQIRRRRLRDQYFGPIFADAPWDILLDLAAARKEGRAVAVSSLCIAAAVPPTTALRAIGRLEEDGLIERRADPRDGRRVFIALTKNAAAGMDAWLQATSRIG